MFNHDVKESKSIVQKESKPSTVPDVKSIPPFSHTKIQYEGEEAKAMRTKEHSVLVDGVVVSKDNKFWKKLDSKIYIINPKSPTIEKTLDVDEEMSAPILMPNGNIALFDQQDILQIINYKTFEIKEINLSCIEPEQDVSALVFLTNTMIAITSSKQDVISLIDIEKDILIKEITVRENVLSRSHYLNSFMYVYKNEWILLNGQDLRLVNIHNNQNILIGNGIYTKDDILITEDHKIFCSRYGEVSINELQNNQLNAIVSFWPNVGKFHFRCYLEKEKMLIGFNEYDNALGFWKLDIGPLDVWTPARTASRKQANCVYTIAVEKTPEHADIQNASDAQVLVDENANIYYLSHLNASVGVIHYKDFKDHLNKERQENFRQILDTTAICPDASRMITEYSVLSHAAFFQPAPSIPNAEDIIEYEKINKLDEMLNCTLNQLLQVNDKAACNAVRDTIFQSLRNISQRNNRYTDRVEEVISNYQKEEKQFLEKRHPSPVNHH